MESSLAGLAADCSWQNLAASLEPVQQVPKGRGVRPEGVVPHRLGRLTVAEQVRDDDAVVLVQPVDEVGPLALAPEDAVDEQQRRATTAVAVGEGVPVKGHRVLGGRHVHGGS